ncbi:MAG: RNA 3'-terminal phosphate cyclase [Myxococcota bacterium]
MLTIDGSYGEGGGQVLRTALGLSAVTGTAFRIRSIRAGRAKPGLLRQHLTGVRAVAERTGATVTGDALGSTELTFEPGPIRAGATSVAVGSAGSAGLVLQAVLPALVRAPGPSTIEISGGTHNSASPPAPFLQHVLLPLLRRIGVEATLSVDAVGFYPAGGGKYTVQVTPGPLAPLELLERGEIRAVEPIAIVSKVPGSVGSRELAEVARALAGAGLPLGPGRIHSVSSPGPGNAVWIGVEAEHLTAGFTAFGEKGRPAESVAQAAADELLRWHAHGAPVDEHLADQLLVFLALAGGGRFRTGPPSLHTTTNAEIVSKFLPVRFEFAPRPDGTVVVEVHA